MNEQTRRAWLDARRHGIGGSDAAAILGIDPWKGPYSVYQSKVSPIGEKLAPINDAMYWGNTLESIVADEFAKRSGFAVWETKPLWQPGQTFPLFRHHEYEWMTASLDRFVCSKCDGPEEHRKARHGADSFLECKTAREGQQTKWDTGVPENYYAQVQHYLAVTGFAFCFVACLIGGSTYITHKVERNEKYIANLIQKEAEFWERVQKRNPPPPDDSEATIALLNATEAEKGKAIELEPYGTFGVIHSLKEVKDSIATLEAQKRRLENELKHRLGEAELGFIDGRCVVTWKEQSRVSINGDKLWKELPDVAKKYAKISRFRVLRVQEIETGE